MLGKPGGLLYPAFGLHAVKRKLVQMKIGKHHRKKLQFSSNSCWKLSFALCFIGFMMLQVIKKWSLGIYKHQLTDSQNLPRTFAPTFRVGSRKSPVSVVKDMLTNSWRIMVDPFFSGILSLFVKKTPCFLMTRMCSSKKPSLLQHIPSMKCTENCDQILAWIMAEWPRAPSLSFHFLHFSSPKNGGRKTTKSGFTTSRFLVWPLGLQLGFNSLRLRPCLCFCQGGWTMLQSHESETTRRFFRLDVANLFLFFRTNHFAFPWTLTFWLFSDCRFFGKSWKKYEEPFYKLSHMLHPSCENCGFALTGFQRAKTKSIQKPYVFLMDCNDISSFLTCFPLPFPCKVFSSCKFAMTAWFASADFYRIPFVASKPLIWRVFPNCLTSFISRWGNGGSPNSDSCNLILTACWHLQERVT